MRYQILIHVNRFSSQFIDFDILYHYLLQSYIFWSWIRDTRYCFHFIDFDKNTQILIWVHSFWFFIPDFDFRLFGTRGEMCWRKTPISPRKKTPPDFKKRPYGIGIPAGSGIGYRLIWDLGFICYMICGVGMRHHPIWWRNVEGERNNITEPSFLFTTSLISRKHNWNNVRKSHE